MSARPADLGLVRATFGWRVETKRDGSLLLGWDLPDGRTRSMEVSPSGVLWAAVVNLARRIAHHGASRWS